MSEYCENCYKLQAQYDKVVEQNRQLQQERMQLISNNNFINSELNQIKLLLEGKNTECEELKKAAFTLAEGLNFRQKKLEEIEVICNAQDFYVDSTAWEIFKIIKEAKDGKNDK